MSGGSYNYLCFKDSSEIQAHVSELEEMAERLSKLGYAQDAAQATYRVLETIRVSQDYLAVLLKNLYGVWHAVEWWDSGDSGEDALREELESFRHPRGLRQKPQ